uniref:Uncharacterized protein n=1 Tax=Panagrolaimus sp. ES5 TaxID=591445 RepID=A0AC34GRJ1_9BILA
MSSKMVFAAVMFVTLCLFIEPNFAMRLPGAYLLPTDNLFLPRLSEVKRFRSEPIRFGKRAPFREPVRFGKRSWPSAYDQEYVTFDETK